MWAFSWQDLLVMAAVIGGALWSTAKYPGSDESAYVRFCSALTVSVYVATLTAFQDYFTRLDHNVNWVSNVFNIQMPVVAYIVIITIGIGSGLKSIIVVALSSFDSDWARKVISILASAIQCLILAHTLTLETHVAVTTASGG